MYYMPSHPLSILFNKQSKILKKEHEIKEQTNNMEYIANDIYGKQSEPQQSGRHHFYQAVLEQLNTSLKVILS